jgi:hypothetical protein
MAAALTVVVLGKRYLRCLKNRLEREDGGEKAQEPRHVNESGGWTCSESRGGDTLVKSLLVMLVMVLMVMTRSNGKRHVKEITKFSALAEWGRS